LLAAKAKAQWLKKSSFFLHLLPKLRPNLGSCNYINIPFARERRLPPRGAIRPLVPVARPTLLRFSVSGKTLQGLKKVSARVSKVVDVDICVILPLLILLLGCALLIYGSKVEVRVPLTLCGIIESFGSRDKLAKFFIYRLFGEVLNNSWNCFNAQKKSYGFVSPFLCDFTWLQFCKDFFAF
jgi:hypothetical protein